MKKGFTLVELLAVMFIISILAAVVIVNVNSARVKARDSRRISDIVTYRDALEMFADHNNGLYPVSSAAPAVEINSTQPVWQTGVLKTALKDTNYLGNLPVDPKNNITVGAITYRYGYISSASVIAGGNVAANYKMCASLMEGDTGKAKARNAEDGGTNENAYEVYSAEGRMLACN